MFTILCGFNDEKSAADDVVCLGLSGMRGMDIIVPQAEKRRTLAQRMEIPPGNTAQEIPALTLRLVRVIGFVGFDLAPQSGLFLETAQV